VTVHWWHSVYCISTTCFHILYHFLVATLEGDVLVLHFLFVLPPVFLLVILYLRGNTYLPPINYVILYHHHHLPGTPVHSSFLTILHSRHVYGGRGIRIILECVRHSFVGDILVTSVHFISFYRLWRLTFWSTTCYTTCISFHLPFLSTWYVLHCVSVCSVLFYHGRWNFWCSYLLFLFWAVHCSHWSAPPPPFIS